MFGIISYQVYITIKKIDYAYILTIKVRENRMGNQEWTIQKYWRHLADKTQDGDKQKHKAQHDMCWTSPNTRHKTETNKNKKHNIICVGHHYTQANINKVNKTWTLSQTTLGKNYHNWSGFIFMFCYYTVGELELWHVILDQMNNKDRNHGYIGYTSHRTTINKTKNTAQKIRKMSNTDPTKNSRVNLGIREG